MHLPETMTIRRFAAHERKRDHRDETREQEDRAESAEPRRTDRHQRDRNRHLAHRQANPDRARETLRHPKLQRRPTRPCEIGELRYASDEKHTRQQDPRGKKARSIARASMLHPPVVRFNQRHDGLTASQDRRRPATSPAR